MREQKEPTRRYRSGGHFVTPMPFITFLKLLYTKVDFFQTRPQSLLCDCGFCLLIFLFRYPAAKYIKRKGESRPQYQEYDAEYNGHSGYGLAVFGAGEYGVE